MDIGIVSLNDKIKSVNFPGRLFSYLMANKPIILLTEKNNELSKFVDSNQIGVNVSIKKFSNKKFLRIEKINNKFKRNNLYAFNFLKKNFSLSKIITQIESNL